MNNSGGWYRNNGVIYNYEINKTNTDSVITTDIRGELINTGQFLQIAQTPSVFLSYINAEFTNEGLIKNSSPGIFNNFGELFLNGTCNMDNSSTFNNNSWGLIINNSNTDSSIIDSITNNYGGVIETAIHFTNRTDNGIYWYRDGHRETDDAQDEYEAAVDELSAHLGVNVELGDFNQDKINYDRWVKIRGGTPHTNLDKIYGGWALENKYVLMDSFLLSENLTITPGNELRIQKNPNTDDTNIYGTKRPRLYITGNTTLTVNNTSTFRIVSGKVYNYGLIDNSGTILNNANLTNNKEIRNQNIFINQTPHIDSQAIFINNDSILTSGTFTNKVNTIVENNSYFENSGILHNYHEIKNVFGSYLVNKNYFTNHLSGTVTNKSIIKVMADNGSIEGVMDNYGNYLNNYETIVWGDFINRAGGTNGVVTNNSIFAIKVDGSVDNQGTFNNNLFGIISNSENDNIMQNVSNKYGGIIESHQAVFTNFVEDNGINFVHNLDPTKILKAQINTGLNQGLSRLAETLGRTDSTLIRDWYESWYIEKIAGNKRVILREDLRPDHKNNPYVLLHAQDYIDEYELKFYRVFIEKYDETRPWGYDTERKLWRLLLSKEPLALSTPIGDFDERVKTFFTGLA